MNYREAEKYIRMLRRWYIAAITVVSSAIIALIIYVLIIHLTAGERSTGFISQSGLIIALSIFGALMVTYIIAYFSLKNRIPIAYTAGVSALSLTMLWLPIGTAIGIFLLARLTRPEVRRYLGH